MHVCTTGFMPDCGTIGRSDNDHLVTALVGAIRVWPTSRSRTRGRYEVQADIEEFGLVSGKELVQEFLSREASGYLLLRAKPIATDQEQDDEAQSDRSFH
jgi:hypothetical protein